MRKSKVYLERIERLRVSLEDSSCCAYLITNYSDLYYLTGLKLSLGVLIVGRLDACLFVDGRYFEVARALSPIPFEPLKEEKIVDFLKGSGRIGFDPDKASYKDYSELRKWGRKAKVKLTPLAHILQKLRLIKDSWEIEKMKASAALNYRGYQYIQKKIKPGVTEIELVKQLEIYFLKQGAEKMAFDPIIAFGKNSALPHHMSGTTQLKREDIVLLDMGIVLDGYCSDMTRVHFVGKIDSKLRHLFEVNQAAQRAALRQCKVGTRLKELDIAARKVMRSAHLEELYVHSLGHGIGLDVHEFPRVGQSGVDRNLKLEAGMAITIEPGLYLPGKGGVRYEDTVLITPKGVENFYPSL